MPARRALSPKRDSPSDSSTVPIAGPTAAWVSGLGWRALKGGRTCFCYADRSFSLELMLAGPRDSHPQVSPACIETTDRHSSTTPQKTTQILRFSPNAAGRSKTTHWCYQFACVNAKCATFWPMFAVGKSHPPQQAQRGLRRCLHLLRDLWPIRKPGPGPKNTFKLVSPYLS